MKVVKITSSYGTVINKIAVVHIKVVIYTLEIIIMIQNIGCFEPRNKKKS